MENASAGISTRIRREGRRSLFGGCQVMFSANVGIRTSYFQDGLMAELIQLGSPNGVLTKSVIFVHGLGGDPRSTWTSPPPPENNIWPKWLAEDVEGLAVWSVCDNVSCWSWHNGCRFFIIGCRCGAHRGRCRVITSLVTAKVALRVAESRMMVDEKLARLKGQMDQDLTRAKVGFDKELNEQKARLDQKTEFAAERVAYELMMHNVWPWRSFRIIKHHLGGFNDDELRKILVRAGAIRWTASNDEEVWGLLNRNRDYIGVERLTFQLGSLKKKIDDGEVTQIAEVPRDWGA